MAHILPHPQTPLTTLYRATVHSNRNTWVCSRYGTIISPCEHFPSFEDFLKARSTQEQWCYQFLKEPDRCEQLVQDIKQCSLLAVSDGSYMLDWAITSLILNGESHTRVENSVIAPGGKQDMSAYRGELMDIYSTVILILRICEFYGIEDGKVTFGCDVLFALWHAFNTSFPAKVDEPCYDLIAAMHKLLSKSSIKCCPRHINSHQDDKK